MPPLQSWSQRSPKIAAGTRQLLSVIAADNLGYFPPEADLGTPSGFSRDQSQELKVKTWKGIAMGPCIPPPSS